jgi:hypothetical protein
MRSDLFFPTIEGEARILLLINAFSGRGRSLEGRTKLAKLDFFLRYPAYFARALEVRHGIKASISTVAAVQIAAAEGDTIETQMVRYRYGPWDPAYFGILGRLIGKALVDPVPAERGIGYRTTSKGNELASNLAKTPEWQVVADRAALLLRYFDVSGERLKKLIYAQFPEIVSAQWGKQL